MAVIRSMVPLYRSPNILLSGSASDLIRFGNKDKLVTGDDGLAKLYSIHAQEDSEPAGMFKLLSKQQA